MPKLLLWRLLLIEKRTFGIVISYNSAKDARGDRAEYFALKTLQESSSKKVLDWRRLR